MFLSRDAVSTKKENVLKRGTNRWEKIPEKMKGMVKRKFQRSSSRSGLVSWISPKLIVPRNYPRS